MTKNLISIKDSILRILDGISEKELVVLIYSENVKFIEELLEKKITTSLRSGSLFSLSNVKLNKLKQEDLRILREYLDYLNMIGE